MALLTDSYRKKICAGFASGSAVPKAVQMAFGDGGLDDGIVRTETGAETALVNELLRKDIESYAMADDGKTVKVRCTINRDELVGVSITEFGVFDAAGDLAAIQFCEPQKKDEDFRYTFEVECRF